MCIIPEALHKVIDEAAEKSPDMNIPNNDDPVDEDCTVENAVHTQ